jgi:trehalose 6-phosphate synthase/phosphatase
VASRDREDGALILSEFAGAASEMGEAILVNPYDVYGLAEAMRTAVEMPADEQRRRMRLLRRRVLEHDNLAWSRSFMEALDQAALRNATRCQLLREPLVGRLVERIAAARRVFLFLDHDGTLTPIAPRPELASPSADTLALLEAFRVLPSVSLSIVTGRSRAFCREHFDNLPVSLIAEHGAFIRPHGSRDWQVLVSAEEFEHIRPSILSLLELYCRCVPGTHIEEKETALVWHYRQAEPVFARSQALELSEALSKLLANTPFAAFQGKKNIEICPVAASKGRAIESILGTMEWRPEDALITIGDDKTDEGMHRVYPEHNIAIHVGAPNLFAKYYLEGPRDVLALLGDLYTRLRQASSLRADAR